MCRKQNLESFLEAIGTADQWLWVPNGSSVSASEARSAFNLVAKGILGPGRRCNKTVRIYVQRPVQYSFFTCLKFPKCTQEFVEMAEALGSRTLCVAALSAATMSMQTARMMVRRSPLPRTARLPFSPALFLGAAFGEGRRGSNGTHRTHLKAAKPSGGGRWTAQHTPRVGRELAPGRAMSPSGRSRPQREGREITGWFWPCARSQLPPLEFEFQAHRGPNSH